jgi:hypothetical protein
MVLAGASFEILGQLINLLEQMNDEEYCQPLDVISKNTIGKHVRHIVEFYEEMLKGYEAGLIDYDARLRNTRLETERTFVISSLNSINNKLFTIKSDSPLKLALSVGLTDEKYAIDTTIYREIAYNIEHTIHHFAIIKIAIDTAFDGISLPENFGIAYSTIKHQQTVCAQ